MLLPTVGIRNKDIYTACGCNMWRRSINNEREIERERERERERKASTMAKVINKICIVIGCKYFSNDLEISFPLHENAHTHYLFYLQHGGKSIYFDLKHE